MRGDNAHPEIRIEPVDDKRGREAFIRAPWPIYGDDPAWRAPLLFEQRRRLSPQTNPGLAEMPHQLFMARRDGRPVGRISAQLNRAHLARHKDETGHFGFFEVEDDDEAARALISAAEDWLRQHGAARIAGPFSFSVNEECGLLVDGFETPPSLMMPHGRPYYARLLEAMGFEKAMDMYAYRFDAITSRIPETQQRFIDRLQRNPAFSIRGLTPGEFADDVRVVMDIFNEAWAENWGFIPFTAAQIAHMADELKPLIGPHSLRIAEWKGEPAAFALALPNINAMTADLDGKLLPFGWAKLLYRLKIDGAKEGRMPLMGVRKAMQNSPIGAGLAFSVIDGVWRACVERGYVAGELSWILETNPAMCAMIEALGAQRYKTYRIYAKAL